MLYRPIVKHIANKIPFVFKTVYLFHILLRIFMIQFSYKSKEMRLNFIKFCFGSE